MDIYVNSVGWNAPFNLNCPPDSRGLIPGNEVESLRQLGEHLRQTFWKALAGGAKATARNPRGNEAKQAIDGNPGTIWHPAAADGERGGPQEFTVDMGAEKTLKGFTYLPCQDHTLHGMVDQYAFAVSQDGKRWTTASAGEFGKPARQSGRTNRAVCAGQGPALQVRRQARAGKKPHGRLLQNSRKRRRNASVSPSPPADGGEGRGEEGRFYWEFPSPRSSPHSCVVGRGRFNAEVLKEPHGCGFFKTPWLPTFVGANLRNFSADSRPRLRFCKKLGCGGNWGDGVNH